VPANPHKKAVVYPNGFTTFDELRPGEKINLPDKWFSKEFDELPPVYFRALPHPDGKTPSVLGALADGVLSDFAALEEAATRVGALAAMSDGEFSLNMSAAADSIDRAVQGASGPDADAARAATASARSEKVTLDSAIAAGDQGVAFNARDTIIHDLSDGLVAARKAVDSAHASIPTATAPAASSAPAAVTALTSIDPCAPANVAAVCAAQRALGRTVDGKYGGDTASAARQVVLDAPAGCAPRPAWWHAAGVSNCPGATTRPNSSPSETLTTPVGDQKKSLSVAGVLGLGLLGMGVVGGAIYLTTRARRRAPPSPRRSTGRKKKR